MPLTMPVNIVVTGLKTVLFVSSNASEGIPILSLKEEINLRKVLFILIPRLIQMVNETVRG